MASVTKSTTRQDLSDINDLINKLNNEAARRGLSDRVNVASNQEPLKFNTIKSIEEIRRKIGNTRYQNSGTCSSVNVKPSGYSGANLQTTAPSGEQTLSHYKRSFASQYNTILKDVELLAAQCGCNSVGTSCGVNQSCGCHAQCSCQEQKTCSCDDVCTCQSQNKGCDCDDVCSCQSQDACNCQNNTWYDNCCESNYVCDCDYVCSCDTVSEYVLYDGMTGNELDEFLASNGLDWGDFESLCGVCVECVEDTDYCSCDNENLECDCNDNRIPCTCVKVDCGSNHKYTCPCENQSCSTNHSYSCPCESVTTNPPCQCNTVSDCSNVCAADCTCDKVCVEYATNM